MKRLLILFILMSEVASAEGFLRVRPHVVVTPGSDVTLAQLVDAHDVSASLLEKMKSIFLTEAPALGEKQELSSANISSVLRPLVAEEKASSSNAVRILIPSNVVIDTLNRDISADLVKAELLQAWNPLCRDCHLEISQLSLPRVGHLRDWSLRLSSDLPRGSFSVPVELIKEDGSPLTAWISGRLAVKEKVPVATRLLNIGDQIQPEDIRWVYRDVSFADDGIPTMDDFHNKRLTQGIRANQIIWASVLRPERAVHNGDVVQAKLSGGSWEVWVSMVAQKDAYIGDVINVKNPRTHTMLLGKVTGQGQVVLQ